MKLNTLLCHLDQQLSTDENAQRIGTLIAEVFSLKKSKEHPDRFETLQGTKTATGIGRVTIAAILQSCTPVDWQTMEKEIKTQLIALKKGIAHDYRASEEDTTPGISVTFSTKDGSNWNYQTGDNSYTGSCYGDPHWSVVSLYRRSNCVQLAKEICEELQEAIAQSV